MHDTLDFEGRGKPAVFVASSAFGEAADVQARALGAESSYVLVPHPIQDRTDDEMRDLADAAADEIVRALTGS